MGIKVLLTGKPGIGKSTIVDAITKQLHMPLRGIIAEDVADENGMRTGFQAVTFNGAKHLCAHKYNIKSYYAIEDFFVDVGAIDNFISPEIECGLADPSSILVIDEIGRMQSLSARFMTALQASFDDPHTNILSTIVLEPEPWSLPFRQHPDAILLEVDREHQAIISNFLVTLFNNLELVKRLRAEQLHTMTFIANTYAKENKYLQLSKLFCHAIFYVAYSRIREMSHGIFLVQGHHGNHIVNHGRCSCDLFNGRNEYANTPGECSHLQAIKMMCW